ncbi:hypothetical protein JCM10003_2176 [Bacteroides pyogenes JCM 10003]|nr:hypothetical protein JCM10003_2176 [Bacteroides pyogenes JCM 10003]
MGNSCVTSMKNNETLHVCFKTPFCEARRGGGKTTKLRMFGSLCIELEDARPLGVKDRLPSFI